VVLPPECDAPVAVIFGAAEPMIGAGAVRGIPRLRHMAFIESIR
jgi:predicted aconitase with swiveling domain